MVFGPWVRSARTRIGLKQFEMADALDVHWTTLSRWERGVVEPRPQQLTAIARLYLKEIVAQELWVHGEPAANTHIRRAAAFCRHGQTTGAQWFILDALARGERVNLLLSDQTASSQDLTALMPAEGPLSSPVGEQQVRVLPLQSVFSFGERGLDVRKAVSVITQEEAAAAEQGCSGVAWIGDLRTVLQDHAVQADIMTLERLTEYLARTGSSPSRGLVLYHASQERTALMACLLCSHSLVMTSEGPVHNPFHNDRSLCIARLLEEEVQRPADVAQTLAQCKLDSCDREGKTPDDSP